MGRCGAGQLLDMEEDCQIRTEIPFRVISLAYFLLHISFAAGFPAVLSLSLSLEHFFVAQHKVNPSLSLGSGSGKWAVEPARSLKHFLA